ncbi:DUF4178 domain-containing protein [Sagittula salina]|uniref:DUF4178 domain-containing protein n=1 Tax=Sagittula salina TaxID=2820268 RepID=A0A940MRM8_9RHOB|nr:DUF4178 domain-containing protein [Sagittula salina]MBP0484134.1 DUF4178 domain-containing protein [Sagittula salina]
MTRTPTLKSINCTSCGAGLNVLGGGRVLVHICAYCGAELDAQENYRILKKFDARPRPDTPLALGMSGTLMGVDWTVIGTIGKTESGVDWVEHQLYSPTHGYAWLSVEGGHFTFSRRIRRPVTPPWISSRMVDRAEHRPTALLLGERYTYYETSLATTSYLEGEFTWAPEMGEKTKTVSLISETAMLDYGTAGEAAEREIYRSVYVSGAVVQAAFELDALPTAQGSHPLQPRRGGGNETFVIRAALAMAALCVVLAIVVSYGMPQRTALPATWVEVAKLPQTLDFDVASTEQLVRVDFNATPSNAWLFVGFEVVDPEGETLFESGRSMEYYSGRDSDGRWSEGNTSANLKFRPPATGTYQLVLSESENEPWAGGSPPSGFSVSAREGQGAPFWLVLLAVVFGLIAAAQWGLRRRRHQRRFADSDWTEED